MPRPRAKRARISTNNIKGISPLNTATNNDIQLIYTNGTNGKCKFVELPVELLLEIMSYYPAVIIPTSRRYNTPVLPPSVFQRWDVLRALSQTCKLWRSIFFPMLWERMEACAVRELKTKPIPRNNQPGAPGPSNIAQEQDFYNFRSEDLPPSWFKGVSSLLENVCKGLSKDPQAAGHVRTVNVALTRCSYTTVLPAFVECLENLPNLQTLQILRAHTQMSPMLKSYFEGRSFPSVRTVIVPEHGHEILRCCPGARKVICNYGDGSKIITAIGKCCKRVEIVEGIDPDKNYLKRLAKACPELRELKLNVGIETNTAQVLVALMSFKKLIRLEVQISRICASLDFQKEPIISQIIKAGKSLLDTQATGKKTLRIFHEPGWDPLDQAWSLDVPV